MTTPELLRKAAEALDDGTDPFSTAFLSEHDVKMAAAAAVLLLVP